MGVLLTCDAISKSHGVRLLFQGVSLSLSDGDRFGLIGPNGSGKSTLLRILAGFEPAGGGAVSVRKLARAAYVPQEPDFPAEVTVGGLLEETLAPLALEPEEKVARLNVTAGRLGFHDLAARAGALSGGWRKRLALARALVVEPDLLLLDEPTNHLDIEGILWLERALKAGPFTSVFVSHDRYFLENVANRLGELNRAYPDGIFHVPGNYSEFLSRREDFLESQRKLQESLAVKVRREIEWLRRGPKARTGKSKARIEEAGRLIGELDNVTARNATHTASIDFTATDRRTKRLIAAEAVGKRMGDQTLFASLSFVLSPGVTMGLVGANGTGKTTLLRMLAGELDPDEGELRRAEALRIVYFDQNRAQLDPSISLRRALAPEGDSVLYRGRPIHVAGWAKRFLFSAEHLELPVGSLSGGEQARVLIARLMLQPADVLLLDEPTNDLDIPTLEVLEESLTEFGGALVLVTHDRFLLDRLASFVVGINGDGSAGVFADLAQWSAALAGRRDARPVEKGQPREKLAAAPAAKRKLSYVEQREFDAMESRILAAEEKLEEFKRQMQAPGVVSDPVRLNQSYEAMLAAQADVEALYQRWAELESKLA